MSGNVAMALEALVRKGAESHLAQLQRGLEKESLRVDTTGLLAQTPHPRTLGSTLTHPSITTDYSESLLEFVTGVHTDIQGLLNEMHDIHHFVYRHIGNEKLWVNSMPCIVESEEKIPIARYGTSNIAKMKETYRRGLSHRYGSLMQAIAGIHFNFSLPDSFWEACLDANDDEQMRDGKSDRYFALIRNFHRHSWLSSYLFGASPAVCRTFLVGREHKLEDFDAHSFYAPDATSLRLSGLGYTNEAQDQVGISYAGIREFTNSLRHAIQTPHHEYEKIGVRVNGEYRQLNANLLQIENEFYSSIRPKRVAASGESPSRALLQRGVEYVEVRSVDLNPFEPIGIHADCVRFFDMFLLYCMLSESREMSQKEFLLTRENQKTMVMAGRNRDARILKSDESIHARDEMVSILDGMQPIAALLDQVNGSDDYRNTMEKQRAKVQDPGLTPSARIIQGMVEDNLSFYEFSMQASVRSEQIFKQNTLDPEVNARYETLARESHVKRQEIENGDTLSFEAFLDDYFQRQNG